MSTYTWSDALGLVGSTGARPGEDFGPLLCNLAQNMIWNAADWRWSLATLPPFYLVPLQQDYGSPIAVVPSDFAGLRTAFLVNISCDPSARIPLEVRRVLDATHNLGLPSLISYEASLSKFRVFPRTPDAIPSTDYLIEGTYKKRPTKVTGDNIQSTTIPCDDAYFDVCVEALRYQAMKAAGNPNAGIPMVDKRSGSVRYTGQMAVAMEAIIRMADEESIQFGSDSVSPSSPLLMTS